VRKRNQPTQLGTQRRLQALMARSWSMQAVAGSVGLRAPNLPRHLRTAARSRPNSRRRSARPTTSFGTRRRLYRHRQNAPSPTPPAPSPGCAAGLCRRPGATTRSTSLTRSLQVARCGPREQSVGPPAWPKTHASSIARAATNTRGRAPSRSASALARRSCRRRSACSGQRSPPTASLMRDEWGCVTVHRCCAAG
jgi:hypothetical protein